MLTNEYPNPNTAHVEPIKKRVNLWEVCETASCFELPLEISHAQGHDWHHIPEQAVVQRSEMVVTATLTRHFALQQTPSLASGPDKRAGLQIVSHRHCHQVAQALSYPCQGGCSRKMVPVPAVNMPQKFREVLLVAHILHGRELPEVPKRFHVPVPHLYNRDACLSSV